MNLISMGSLAAALLLSACATSGSKSASTEPEPKAAAAKTAEVELCQDANACVQSIYGRIIKNWQIPVNTDPSLSAVLQVSLQEDFNLAAVKVVQSSGQTGFDQSIERAISLAAPFSELQGLAGKEDLANFRQFEIGFQSRMQQSEQQSRQTQAIQQLWALPCQQVNSQLDAFRRQKPKQPLEQAPLWTMTTGALMLSAESQQLSSAQQQTLAGALPAVYAKVQKQCRKQPKQVLKSVLKQHLPARTVQL